MERSTTTESPRSASRQPISAEVQLRRSGELNFVVDAYDLSELGCRTEFVERPRLGEIVWVKFEGLAPIESTVRWVDGFVGGLEFNRPIHSGVLADLLARVRPSGKE